MTVQTKVSYDGEEVITRTYRNVFKNVNLAEIREGFYAQENWCQWGTMVQLKGKERIVLGRFGVDDEN